MRRPRYRYSDETGRKAYDRAQAALDRLGLGYRASQEVRRIENWHRWPDIQAALFSLLSQQSAFLATQAAERPTDKHGRLLGEGWQELAHDLPG